MANAETPTLEERAIAIADEYGISKETFTNLIESESSWNPDAYNKETKDRGLLQISEKYHAEVDDTCAFSPDCAMRWAAQRIKDGYLSEWTPANCYAYMRTLIPNLPLMSRIQPNSAPHKGSIAIFTYSGTPHLAYVLEVKNDGFSIKEANYEPAKITTRFIKWNSDKHLNGFFDPNQ